MTYKCGISIDLIQKTHLDPYTCSLWFSKPHFNIGSRLLQIQTETSHDIPPISKYGRACKMQTTPKKQDKVGLHISLGMNNPQNILKMSRKLKILPKKIVG